MSIYRISSRKLCTLICEAIENEKVAYHGSGANFEKFNHKKYLNSGAGSQSFGWGTYVTEDPIIAQNYAQSAAEHKAKSKYSYEEPSLLYRGEEIYQDDLSKIYKCSTDVARMVAFLLFNRGNGDFNECLEDLKERIEDTEYKLRNMSDDNQIQRTNKILDTYSKAYELINDMIFDSNIEYGYFNNGYVYEVDIPENNGSNYIDWYSEFPHEFMRRVIQGLMNLGDNFLQKIAKSNYPFGQFYRYLQIAKENPKMIDLLVNEDGYYSFFGSGNYTNETRGDGKSVYRYLQKLLGSDKAASLFLMNMCGFDGIIYETGTRWQKPEGAMEDGHNFVLFNINAVKITKKDELKNIVNL